MIHGLWIIIDTNVILKNVKLAFPSRPSYILDFTSLPRAGAAYVSNFEGPANEG